MFNIAGKLSGFLELIIFNDEEKKKLWSRVELFFWEWQVVLFRGKCFINAEAPLSKVANFEKEQIGGAYYNAVGQVQNSKVRQNHRKK